MALDDVKCPVCSSPMSTAKPPAPQAIPIQTPATPGERGAGKLAPGPATVPTPSPANKTQKKVSN